MSRHWFLTGASSGIGRHLAEIILASGDDLTATVRRPETLDDLAARYGDQLVVERLDVTVKGDIAPVVQRAEARRPVDVLVNNAGGGRADQPQPAGAGARHAGLHSRHAHTASRSDHPNLQRQWPRLPADQQSLPRREMGSGRLQRMPSPGTGGVWGLRHTH